MGIASMVIGIVAALVALIPFCGVMALIPAIVGLALGIVDVILKKKKQAPIRISIAGIALNGAAVVFIILYALIFASAVVSAAGAAAKAQEMQMQQRQQPQSAPQPPPR